MARHVLILLLPGLLAILVPSVDAEPAHERARRLEVIDLDGVPALGLETPNRVFRPKPFTTPDGGTGWIVRHTKSAANASRPHVPSPAVDEGRVFVGGGLSSREVLAFDARRGKLLWSARLNDNGPSSVAVSRGTVVVNTESCTTYGIEVKTGTIRWSRVLGPSVHAAPSVVGRRVLAAGRSARGSFALFALDLGKGKELWRRILSSDLIGAPVHAEGRIYLSGQDGHVACFDLRGKPVWSVRAGATSAPWVGPGGLYVATRSRRGFAGTAVLRMDHRNGRVLWRTDAPRSRSEGDPVTVAYPTSRRPVVSSVGWCVDPPRPVIHRDLCALGAGSDLVLNDPGTGEETLRLRLPPGRTFHAPPAILGANLLFATREGLLLEIEPTSGEPRRALDLGMSFTSQPVVARGRVYVTSGPFLICVPWGVPGDPEWPQWSGSADRSGRE